MIDVERNNRKHFLKRIQATVDKMRNRIDKLEDDMDAIEMLADALKPDVPAKKGS